ncbi:MAG: DUF6498-containing protein, partial [Candidatus Staskawiczbacteria bacterium]|nr:DUF6498-containing protein [Candidatus Staskawiczbacteria bacterium]
LALIFSNVLTIILALTQNWDFLTILWVYWSQSVIIGIFSYLKILSAKQFDVGNMMFNNKPLSNDKKSKLIIANFFAFHYGFFHIGYFFFLWFFSHIIPTIANEPSTVNFQEIYIGAGIFFTNHLFSYFYNRRKEINKKQNIKHLMFFPYLRVLPMQLTFVIGLPITMFLILKSAVDVIMQTIENNLNMEF